MEDNYVSRTWNVAYLKVLFRDLYGENEENIEDRNLANSDVQKHIYRSLVNALLLLSPLSVFWCAPGVLCVPFSSSVINRFDFRHLQRAFRALLLIN